MVILMTSFIDGNLCSHNAKFAMKSNIFKKSCQYSKISLLILIPINILFEVLFRTFIYEFLYLSSSAKCCSSMADLYALLGSSWKKCGFLITEMNINVLLAFTELLNKRINSKIMSFK